MMHFSRGERLLSTRYTPGGVFTKRKRKAKHEKREKKGDKEFVKRKRRGYGRRAEKEDVTWGSIFPCALGSGGRPNDIRVRKSPETRVGEEEKN